MGTCTATILAALHSTNKRVDAIKAEVTPNNGLSAGETIDRVYSAVIDIKQGARTPGEEEHVAKMQQNEDEGGVAAE